MRNFKLISYEELKQIPTPEKTDTYTPISYEDLYYITRDNLDHYNLDTTNVDILFNKLRGIMLAFTIKHDSNEMKPKLVVTSSHNKTKPVKIISGADVTYCSNGNVFGSNNLKRKHTGEVYSVVNQLVRDSVESLLPNFDIFTRKVETMKTLQPNENDVNALLGVLFFKGLINSKMLSSIKKQREGKHKSSTIFTGNTLWDYYNQITESVKITNNQFYKSEKILNEISTRFL